MISVGAVLDHRHHFKGISISKESGGGADVAAQCGAASSLAASISMRWVSNDERESSRSVHKGLIVAHLRLSRR